jgi:hypothetical protein
VQVLAGSGAAVALPRPDVDQGEPMVARELRHPVPVLLPLSLPLFRAEAVHVPRPESEQHVAPIAERLGVPPGVVHLRDDAQGNALARPPGSTVYSAPP